jgi:hypothetical protein
MTRVTTRAINICDIMAHTPASQQPAFANFLLKIPGCTQCSHTTQQILSAHKRVAAIFRAVTMLYVHRFALKRVLHSKQAALAIIVAWVMLLLVISYWFRCVELTACLFGTENELYVLHAVIVHACACCSIFVRATRQKYFDVLGLLLVEALLHPFSIQHTLERTTDVSFHILLVGADEASIVHAYVHISFQNVFPAHTHMQVCCHAT